MQLQSRLAYVLSVFDCFNLIVRATRSAYDNKYEPYGASIIAALKCRFYNIIKAIWFHNCHFNCGFCGTVAIIYVLYDVPVKPV